MKEHILYKRTHAKERESLKDDIEVLEELFLFFFLAKHGRHHLSQTRAHQCMHLLSDLGYTLGLSLGQASSCTDARTPVRVPWKYVRA